MCKLIQRCPVTENLDLEAQCMRCRRASSPTSVCVDLCSPQGSVIKPRTCVACPGGRCWFYARDDDPRTMCKMHEAQLSLFKSSKKAEDMQFQQEMLARRADRADKRDKSLVEKSLVAAVQKQFEKESETATVVASFAEWQLADQMFEVNAAFAVSESF